MSFKHKLDSSRLSEDIAALDHAQTVEAVVERSELLAKVFEEAGETMDHSKVSIITADDGHSIAKQIRNMNDEISQLGEHRDELREMIDIKAIAEREAKAGRALLPGPHPAGGPEGKAKVQLLGDSFVKSKLYEQLKDHHPGREAMEGVDAKALLALKTTFSTGAGFDPEDIRIGRIVMDAQRQIEVIDALPLFTTTMSTIVYMEETTFTSAAAERAEAGTYAESTLQFTEQTSEVRSIGTSLPVTDEQMEDVPFIRDYLNGRLAFMVRQRLDGQILTGDGSSPNLSGTLDQSINTQAKGSDSVPDAVYKGMTAIRVTGRAEPSVCFFHPNDWQAIRLLTTSDGVYIWGSPADAGPERIWGVPVIQTTAETENTAVVGDYAMHSGLFMRRDVVVEAGLDGSDFTSGLVTLRAGLRVALVHFRPAAFTEVTGI